MSETIVRFGCKIFKFCLKIKTFQMLKNEVFFTKFKMMISNIAKINKKLVKKVTSEALIFKIELKD